MSQRTTAKETNPPNPSCSSRESDSGCIGSRSRDYNVDEDNVCDNSYKVMGDGKKADNPVSIERKPESNIDRRNTDGVYVVKNNESRT